MSKTLKELMAEATPRPWRRAVRGYTIQNEEEPDTESWAVFSMSDVEKRPCEANGDTAVMAKANAILIAHCVSTYEELVETLEGIAEGGCSRDDMRKWAKEALTEAQNPELSE